VRDATVLLYGHYDKQPEMTGWDQGLGPWEPVMRGERLYGRGGADDGYAVFAALAALAALDARNIPQRPLRRHDRNLRGIRSYDLPAYLDHSRAATGSRGSRRRARFRLRRLRAAVGDDVAGGRSPGTLTVDVLTEGVHSGDASGIVPSSFRVARNLLDRLEDSLTGASCRRSSTRRSPRKGWSRRAPRRTSWASS
jgi:hypothetical protein